MARPARAGNCNGRLDRSPSAWYIRLSFLESANVISSAWARNSVVDTGSAGGGHALLIILASFVLLGFGYALYKRWRRRSEDAHGDIRSHGQ